jgi:hypothetical protein
MPTTSSLLASMQVEVPEGRSGVMEVRRFEWTENTPGRVWAIAHGRDTPFGWYTGLFEHVNKTPPTSRPGWKVWMSDTLAERRDNLLPVRQVHNLNARRVLISGLGLGMVVKACLALPCVRQLDVVEINPDVISLVGPTYAADPRVTIIPGDARDPGLIPGDAWYDVAWHDIYPDDNPRYAPELMAMFDTWAHRVRWQGAWGEDNILKGAS